MATVTRAAIAAVDSAVDWAEVFRDELPRVLNFMRYQVGDDQLAEDLTAATFEKAWRARSRYRRDRAAFSTWLFTIARNVATDHFRRLASAPQSTALPESAHDGSTEDVVEHRDEMRRLAALVAALPERERELIALKYGAGLTNRDTALQTGLSESNVGTILHRVVVRLRLQMMEETK